MAHSAPNVRCTSCRRGAWAVVKLIDGSRHAGVLYAVDPESGHVVLLRPAKAEADDQAGGSRVAPLVLFGPSIVSMAQSPDAAGTASEAHLARITPADCSPSTQRTTDSEQRRAAVRAALRAERAPFEEHLDGTFVVLDCLQIGPPYARHSCRCENEIGGLDRGHEPHVMPLRSLIKLHTSASVHLENDLARTIPHAIDELDSLTLRLPFGQRQDGKTQLWKQGHGTEMGRVTLQGWRNHIVSDALDL